MAYGPQKYGIRTPHFMPYEAFLLGVGVVFKLLRFYRTPKKVLSDPLRRFYRTPFWPLKRFYRTPVKGLFRTTEKVLSNLSHRNPSFSGYPFETRAALKGTNLRGQTPICGFLWVPAKICGFLRKAAFPKCFVF